MIFRFLLLLAVFCSSIAAQDTESARHLIISVEEGDSSVGFYDSQTRAQLGRVYLGHVKETQRERRGHDERHRSYVGMWPHEVAISPDGKTAYVAHFGLKDYDELIGSTGSTISAIDIEEMCEKHRLYTFGNGSAPVEEQYFKFRAPHGIKFQPHTSRLFVNVEANLNGTNNHHMLIYDVSTKTNVPSYVWDIPEKTHNFIFSKDGQSLWLFSGPDGVTRYTLPTSGTFTKPRKRAHFKPRRGAIRGLTLTPDESSLVASGSGDVIVLDPKTLQVKKTIPVKDVVQFLYSSTTKDGRFALMPAVWEGKLYAIDLAAEPSVAIVEPIVLGSDPVHVALAPRGDAVYVTHGRDNYISVVDISHLGGPETKDPKLIEVSRVRTHDGPNRVATVKLGERQLAIAELIQSQQAKTPQRPKIRFGACLPLSGQNRVEGSDMRLGYQYWRDSVNERGGLFVDGRAHEVQLRFRDTRSRSKGKDADELVTKLTQDLINEAKKDKVPLFFFGTYPTPPNIPAALVAQDSGIPFVTAGAAGVVVYSQVGDKAPKLDNVFGVMSPARGFLNGTMDMMFSDKSLLPTGESPPKTGVFITSDDDGAFQDAETTGRYVLHEYGNKLSLLAPSGNANIPKAFRVKKIRLQDGGELPMITYKHPEGRDEIEDVKTGFDDLLALIRDELSPEMVVLTGHMPQAVDFTVAASKMWPQNSKNAAPKAIVLSVGPGNPSFSHQVAARNASAENLLGASVWSSNQRQYGHDEFIDSLTFHEKFEAKFHKAPSYLTAGAVVCGLVYEEAFRRADSLELGEVRDKLRSISDHAGNSMADGAIELFYSRIDFRDDSEIRGLNDKRPLGTIQLQTVNGLTRDVVLWPKTLRKNTGHLVYPFPGFSNRKSN